jgi:hypothetical protein
MKSFRILGCMLLSLVVLTIQAQRIGCVHSGDGWGTRAEMYALPEPMDFDPQITYRQPVVLISFKDRDFSMDDPIAGVASRLFPRVRASTLCVMPTAPLEKSSDRGEN